jgi:hypothetical protein
VISFINAAVKSPEADSNAQLRKRFINSLLSKGACSDTNP